MRISVKYALWLLPLLLAGCTQKTASTPAPALAPPIVDAPPPKPATVSTADLPPPVIGPAPTAPPATDTAAKAVEAPKKPVHHPKKPATPAPSTTASAQEPANPAPATTPSVSAIGQLSGGDSGDLRTQTQESINATEKAVNGITRTLSDSETKTAAQIREFVKQAREALASGDVDGAHTLAVKAKVLLSELNSQ